MHLRLRDDGELSLQAFGEETHHDVMDLAYPILRAARFEIAEKGDDPDSEASLPLLREAAVRERERVDPQPAPAPLTGQGERVKAMSDAPTSMIDRHVRAAATKVLRRVRRPRDPGKVQ